MGMLVIALWPVACTCSDEGPSPQETASTETATATTAQTELPPKELFIPDASPIVGTGTPPLPALVGTNCPPEMVSIRGQFCIDRFEASLVDVDEERPISPYYHPTFHHTRSAFKTHA